MNRRFVIAAAFLALAACKSSQQGARVDPALSTLIPADTTMLVGIRAEELMKLPIYQRYMADREIGPLDNFAKETGLDLRTDVWEVLLVTNGKESVVLGRGKFGTEAEPRLKAESKGAKRFGYKGYTLIGNEETAVLFLGPSVAGMGSTPGLRRIVDTRDQSNGPPPVLARRMQEVPREAVIWAAYAGAPIDPPQNLPPNFANLVKIMNSIESGSAYMDLRVGVKGKATGSTATDQAGKELHDALRGLLGFARLGTSKENPEMQRMVDAIRVTQEGKNVNVYIDAPEDALTQVLDVFSGRTPVRPPLKGLPK